MSSGSGANATKRNPGRESKSEIFQLLRLDVYTPRHPVVLAYCIPVISHIPQPGTLKQDYVTNQ